MAPAMKGLPELMAGLSQEVWNNIYDFTFSAANDNEINIDASYAPPATLRIDQAINGAASAAYYSNCRFRADDRKVVVDRLVSLPFKHVDLLQDVQYDFLDIPSAWTKATGPAYIEQCQKIQAMRELNLI